MKIFFIAFVTLYFIIGIFMLIFLVQLVDMKYMEEKGMRYNLKKKAEEERMKAKTKSNTA